MIYPKAKRLITFRSVDRIKFLYTEQIPAEEEYVSNLSPHRIEVDNNYDNPRSELVTNLINYVALGKNIPLWGVKSYENGRHGGTRLIVPFATEEEMLFVRLKL